MRILKMVLGIVLLRIAEVLWNHETLVTRLADATSRAGEALLSPSKVYALLERWAR